MKKTLILQCPGMVCSPPVVSKCLGEAHRRLGITLITLHYITLILFFLPILLVITEEQSDSSTVSALAWVGRAPTFIPFKVGFFCVFFCVLERF